MDWMIAALLLLILGGAMPLAIRALKRSASRKRRGGGGFSMALMMGFMAVLDPAKADAIEQVDKRKDLGDAEAGEDGERID